MKSDEKKIEELNEQLLEQKKINENLSMEVENLTVELRIEKNKNGEVPLIRTTSVKIGDIIEFINEEQKNKSQGVNEQVIHFLRIAKDYAISKEKQE